LTHGAQRPRKTSADRIDGLNGNAGLAGRLWSGARPRPPFLLACLMAFAVTMLFAASAADAAVPTVSIDPNPTPGYSSIHITGEIGPTSETVFSTAEVRETGSPERFIEDEATTQEIPAGSGPTPVSVDVTRLIRPGTSYEVRLNVYNPGTEEAANSAEPTVTTKAVEESPTVTLGTLEATSSTTAHLTGLINPNAPEAEPTSADVEKAFGVSWQFECTPTCFGLETEHLAAGNTAKTVEDEAVGLVPGQTYEVKLIAENLGGASTLGEAGPEPFTTPAQAPDIVSVGAAGVTATEATLNASINPGGAPTTYHFEYMTREQFEVAGGFSGPDLRSTPPASAGSEAEYVQVSATVGGLATGATYVFRAVATNTSPGEPTVDSGASRLVTYAGSAPEPQNCANEQLRAENNSLALPECRAYEQVSPSYKQSHGIIAGIGAIAPDGQSIITGSSGAFAGTADDPTGPGGQFGYANYAFDRSPTAGWQVTALDPPAGDVLANPSQGNSMFMPTVNADAMLFELETPNLHSSELWLREADGTFKFISPMVEPGKGGTTEGLAASANDSVVLFSIQSAQGRWEGDLTKSGGNSLYEADGSPEPKLVGVSNLGSLQHNTEASLISDCGTQLAAPHEVLRPHSVSSLGAFVYFQVAPEFAAPGCVGPPVEELYVRVDGEKTIPISQPELPAGQECTGTCFSAARRAALFEGASQDGRSVFFTTSQPLLNVDHDETTDLYEANIVGSGTAAALGKLTLVSRGGAGDATPGEGAEVLGVLTASQDGSQVYFAAGGLLTSTLNAAGEAPQSGAPNLYSVDTATGATTFVATLSTLDEVDWRKSNELRTQATADGRYLVFSSYADLTADDTSESRQLFEYDARDKSLERVSQGDRGFNNDGNANEGEARLGSWSEGRPTISIADDGTVFFTSSIALTPGASSDPENNLRNIYEFQAGRVFLIAPGVGLNNDAAAPEASATQLWGIDASGEDVFFNTLAKLTPTDTDGRPDLYDARVGGGFPVPAVPANCAASASCQGSASSPPGFSPPSTATFSGPRNRKPAKKQKHHKKKHHKKKQKHHKKKHDKKKQKHHKKKHDGPKKSRRGRR
jgi:hypothetical protein